MDQLVSEGAHTDSDQQATVLPKPILKDIGDTARKVLTQIPEANKPHQDYANIQQGPTEPHMTFLDRLKDAIEKQVTDDPQCRKDYSIQFNWLL